MQSSRSSRGRARADAPYNRGGQEIRSNRLYVGNLAYEVRWQDLKDFMRSCGTVTHADVFMDGHRSKGSGIVEFDTVAAAQRAMEELNNAELFGRPIFLREDREAPSVGPVGTAPRSAPPARNAPPRAVNHNAPVPSVTSARIWCGNLPFSAGWQDLKDFARAAGEVVRADVQNGWGTVEYTTPQAAAQAIATLNGQDFQGRPINIREDREADSHVAAAPAHIPVNAHAAPSHLSTRVYVNNLPWTVTGQELEEIFREAGNVRFAEVMTEGSGRSKGCGIVEFSSPADAQQAISMLNNADINGRIIHVREDRGERVNPGATHAHVPHVHEGDVSGRRIYVSNLAYHTDWKSLKDQLVHFGEVAYADVMKLDDGRSKGCGIVEFVTEEAAAEAIRTKEYFLDGRMIFIREDREA